MKKFLWILLVPFVMLTACRRTDPPVTTEPPATVLPPVTVLTTAEPPVSTEPPFVVETVAPEYGDEMDVHYEVLITDDEELNQLLEQAGAAEMARYIPNASSVQENGGTAEYDVVMSSIYKGEEIISAVFSGRYAIYYENSEEGGEVLYTVNIDPKTGRILTTPDIIDYEKMVEAFRSGRFDASPDFSPYNGAYGIYPYVSIEAVNGDKRLCVYVAKSGMYEEVLGYYIPLGDASDFLKMQIEE